MEELLGNIVNARQIFERWMSWHPEEEAWNSYINFELRYEEVNNARAIYERFVLCHGTPKHWIKYAKFEMRQRNPTNARAVYERAIEYFGEDHIDSQLWLWFARFEEGQKEYERARGIYTIALDKIPKSEAEEIFSAYTKFEKQHGNRNSVESVIVDKRRFMYEEEVKLNPSNYDTWFDFIRLEEEIGDSAKIRDVYERAVSNVPPANEKRLWRRYIYLWIYYAVYEETEVKDIVRTREVYRACIRMIPHATFTFAKVWLLFAQFELRQKDVSAARKVLGEALGRCPTEKLFKGYIEIELQLREFDRVRKLYDKFLQFNQANCTTWTKYAELEAILGDMTRARALYELAISQPLLDMPEVLWKAYIDFEAELEEFDRARDLYERLLQKTSHVKVWISYAEFESSIDSDQAVEQARHVYDTADKEIRKGDKAERLLLLESWVAFEEELGDAASVKLVKAKLPRRVKKRREVFGDDGSSEGWEEYYDYIYPDEESAAPNLKLLAMARQWKAKQAATKHAASAVEADSVTPDDGNADAAMMATKSVAETD